MQFIQAGHDLVCPSPFDASGFINRGDSICQASEDAPFNIARFDLVTFHLVVLCARHGSLCEAAKIAHISKSAASHRITTLENSIGRKLFRRSHSGLTLTSAGKICVVHGQAIIQEIRNFKCQIESIINSD